MQTEDERKWEEMKNNIILALHKTMLESELKDQYGLNLRHYRSITNQYNADEFLRPYLEGDVFEDNDDIDVNPVK